MICSVFSRMLNYLKMGNNRSHNADVTSSNLVVATKKNQENSPFRGAFFVSGCVVFQDRSSALRQSSQFQLTEAYRVSFLG